MSVQPLARPRPSRVEEAAILDDLNQSIKVQQAFLNSCADSTWIGDEERQAIRWLLSALIDHRRRVRTSARLWRTLGADEPTPRCLVAETVELIDENRRFEPFIARWRAAAVEQARAQRKELWRSMLELAEANLDDGR